MSRVGKQPVILPAGVEVAVSDDVISISGPKGSLTQKLPAGTTVRLEPGVITVGRDGDDRRARAQHGLQRSLINNLVRGVVSGFSRQLEINGVGYRASLSGSQLQLSLGYSHPVIYNLPDNVSAKLEQNIITISGLENQVVGQIAAEIRALRPPEPYKGKGIRYAGEKILRKSGKSGKEK